jgi:autotransporter passenger strand-loop-strand repeat protein
MSATTIQAGTTSYHLLVTDGATALVSGTAIFTSVASGGIQYVESGGFAYGALIANGGSEIVSSGGTDVSATISSGGTEYLAGGTALGAGVQSGGLLYVSAGGAAVDATLLSGGMDFVTAGGTTTSTSIASGAIDNVSGGTAYGARIGGGGIQLVFGGGDASASTVASGGQALIGSNGAAYGVLVQKLGLAEILAGGSAAGTVISAGGTVLVDSGGAAFSSLIKSGGVEIVQSGAADDASVVASGGTLVALPGASTVDVSGTVTSTGVVLVRPDAAAIIYASSARAIVVSEDATEYVLAGGTAISTTVSGGFSFGVISVYSGGESLSTRINSGGEEFVLAGGIASTTSVASAGYQYVSGGTAYATTLGGEGTLYLIGGATSSAVLSGGSREFVESGGIAAHTVVQAYADELVVSGGIAYQTSIGLNGAEYVDSTGITSNTVIDGGTLVLSRGSTAEGSIMVSGGVLDIDSTQMPTAVISGFAGGDEIYLSSVPYAASDTVNLSAGVVEINANGAQYQLNIAGASGKLALTDMNGDVALTAPCFARGTRILTPRGEIRVEELQIGDAVITLAGEEAPKIIWIGHRHIPLLRHRRPALAQPVRIAAGAFGAGQPARDLLLSPDHAVFHEGVLIPAKALVNGVNITQLNLAGVEYYHIELARHAVMFAEGLAVESYLDTGNRHEFENGGAVTPVHAAQAMREAASCAPFVQDGPIVVALRQSAARRGLLPQAASTSRSMMAPSCSRATARS